MSPNDSKPIRQDECTSHTVLSDENIDFSVLREGLLLRVWDVRKVIAKTA